jgi:hypothetical protein
MDDENKIKPLECDTTALDLSNILRKMVDKAMMVHYTGPVEVEPEDDKQITLVLDESQTILTWSTSIALPESYTPVSDGDLLAGVGKLNEDDWIIAPPASDDVLLVDDCDSNVHEYVFENSTPYIEDMFISSSPISSILSVHNADNKLIVEVNLETGEVTLGNDVSAEHAAHEFWTRLDQLGGHFHERMQALEDEIALVEEDLDDEQSMRLELEEELNKHHVADLLAPRETDLDRQDAVLLHTVRRKLGVPEGQDILKFIDTLALPTSVNTMEENPGVAYKRAMKVVR